VDLTELTNFLAAISSVAVIAGAGFVVLQLRQNAGILKATLRQERSNSAREDHARIVRQEKGGDVRDWERARTSNWEGLDNSEDDFEARNFAHLYELYGVLVQEEILEFRLTTETLNYLVVTDLEIFRPHSEHLMKLFGLKVNPWGNFEWLAHKVDEYMQEEEKKTS
jgi:hypothetical protein